jgi:curved DNA-binding protein CbpA
MDIDTAFEILGLDKYEVTMEDVTKQYKTLLRKYHPDKNKNSNATAKTQEIINAYDIIKGIKHLLPYERPAPRYTPAADAYTPAAAPSYEYAAPPATPSYEYAAPRYTPSAAPSYEYAPPHFSGVEIPTRDELNAQSASSSARRAAMYQEQEKIFKKRKPFDDAAAEVAEILKQGYNKSSKKNPLFGGSRKPKSSRKKNTKKRKQTKKRKGKK